MALQDRDYYKEKLEEIERGGRQKFNILFTIFIIIIILGLVLSSFIFSFR